MRHLRIASDEEESRSEKDDETEAQAKKARRQASQSDGYAHSEKDDTWIVVIIVQTLLGSHDPLEIVRGEKEEHQPFR